MMELTDFAKVMHEEHFRTLVLICGVENRVSGKAANRPINPANGEDRALLEELVAGLDEIVRHNAFEEGVLFPLLRDTGAGDLTVLLTQEHFIMGPLARRLRSVAVSVLEQGAGDGRWEDFRDTALDYAGQLMLHLQKEEMAVVQQLPSLLGPGVDRALMLRYTAERHRHSVEAAGGKAA